MAKNIPDDFLPESIKKAANDAFQDNAKLTDMTLEERELAAKAFEGVASRTVGTKAKLARLYNLERAKFLRGEVSRIAPTAGKFGIEIGYTAI